MENKWCDSCGKMTQWVNGECENYKKSEPGNSRVLTEKIDQYVELVSKLDDKISDYEFQIQELNKQLTQKDNVIDKYISKLHQIRGLSQL